MFGKAGKRVGSVVGGGGSGTTVPSIIGPEMTIRGDLQSDGDLHVEGTIQGDIRVKHLVVAKDAVVRGDVEAHSVRIAGSVIGALRAREVVLTVTAKMQGDIFHDVLSIEPGAMLEGHCRRLEPAAPSAEPLLANANVQPAETGLLLQAPARHSSV